MANASLARAPVLLIGGCTVAAAGQYGAAAGHPACRHPAAGDARRRAPLRVADQVIRELDEAVARAIGDAGEPGPVYIEIPTDVLRTHVPPQLVLDEWMTAEAGAAADRPIRRRSQRRSTRSGRRKRPLVITGRGARGAGAELVRLLDATGALYLDTQESRGLVPADHPSFVGAMRGGGDDGRRPRPRDRPQARLPDRLRLAGRVPERALHSHRRQSPASSSTTGAASRSCWRRPTLALAAMVEAAGNRRARHRQGLGARRCAARHRERVASSAAKKQRPPTRRRRQDASRARSSTRSPSSPTPDYIAIADGGDLLSFARIGLQARTYMDAGAFGCLGVGVPFAIAAVARAAGAAGDLGQRRRRLRHQRHGDRHRRAARRQRRCSSSPTTPPGTSSATTRR